MAALSRTDPTSDLYGARVVVGKRIEGRQVRIGIHDRFTAQITSGLAAGDKVVTGPKPASGQPSLIGFRL
jgi:hypothetical protein